MDGQGVLLTFFCAVLLVGAVLFIGWSKHREPEQVQATIVDVYRDGLAFRKVVTVVELQDGTRRQLRGKYGDEGDVIMVWFNGNDITVRSGK